MNETSIAMAKLAGIRKAVIDLMNENVSRNRSKGEVLTRAHFSPELIQHYFVQAASHLNTLRMKLPELYGDFQELKVEPEVNMATTVIDVTPKHYSRAQAECLVRDIDQVFEIRANSELLPPKSESHGRVFITHGRSNDWRSVQAHIEKDVKLQTIELAQEANLGRTVIEKLLDNAARCDSAVIVMTGDDVANESETRVRENVMHEIGFFQGCYGRNRVVLLHESGVNIPSNLGGLVYIPFPKGLIDAGFHVLDRELKAIYKM